MLFFINGFYDGDQKNKLPDPTALLKVGFLFDRVVWALHVLALATGRRSQGADLENRRSQVNIYPDQFTGYLREIDEKKNTW